MSCWNLRLSESKAKLAWAMPSVSKLNKVNSFQHLTASLFLSFSADRSWNLRLSESRVKLAWTMTSVSKLNNVKRVQDDHQFSSVVFCYIEVQNKLKAHYSLLTTQRPSAKTGNGNVDFSNDIRSMLNVKNRCRSASSRRHFSFLFLFPRVQEPAAILLRVFQTLLSGE